jgi:hypothetical protein
MGIPVMILGESGTGKSASLRNFESGEVSVINVVGKPLPFKTKLKTFNSDNYTAILDVIRRVVEKEQKCIVIDDAQYLMANEFMRRAGENGFQKFTDIGRNYHGLISMVQKLPNNVIVYFLSHVAVDEHGKERCKTIGKMLDEKITIEGLFTIVLKTEVRDGSYYFSTRNSGSDTVKSPIGMFDSDLIDNDLKLVDETIRQYYEL